MTDYTVADYLLDRLADAGIRHLFGVPGDFTLAFLDHVERHPVIEWVGCANELGAGYAADGYARLAGAGALSTTFGVGELSAIGAVAGSFAEHVPVLHIVGAPSTATQRAGRATHHTLGDGDFGHFARMTAEVTAAQGVRDAARAIEQIDRVVAEARVRRLPGYLVVPADVSEAPASPPDGPLRVPVVVSDPDVRRRFADAAARRTATAVRPAVLADILVARVGAESELHQLLDLGLPHATLLWGRRVVDESADAYVGSYLGASSDPAVRTAIEDADLLVLAGVQFTDLTSGFFTQHIESDRTIELRGEYATVGSERFEPLAMADALEELRAAFVGSAWASTRTTPAPAAPSQSLAGAASDSDEPVGLDQMGLWDEVSAFLRPGDTVIADQGTSFYGMADHRLPHDTVFIGQPLWAAIGFTLPAMVGAALARPDRRPVLLIGDGAAQLTVAELGTAIRHRIPAVVVIVDNSGYTVERAIHGLHEEYNDIARWDWVALATSMDPEGRVHAEKATTRAELAGALDRARRSTSLTLIQAVVPPFDVPPVLEALAEAAASANRRAAP